MRFESVGIEGAFVVHLEPRRDERGWFARLLCEETFHEAGLEGRFVQINHSRTLHRGTIRGLHYQIPPMAEVKLMRCVRGAILDVVVDLRASSPTFLEWRAIELSEDNGAQMYVPRGFAHGFQTLTDDVEVTYPTSCAYAPDHERGVRYDDPAVSICWPIDPDEELLSPKDRALPLLDPGFQGVGP